MPLLGKAKSQTDKCRPVFQLLNPYRIVCCCSARSVSGLNRASLHRPIYSWLNQLRFGILGMEYDVIVYSSMDGGKKGELMIYQFATGSCPPLHATAGTNQSSLVLWGDGGEIGGNNWPTNPERSPSWVWPKWRIVAVNKVKPIPLGRVGQKAVCHSIERHRANTCYCSFRKLSLPFSVQFYGGNFVHIILRPHRPMTGFDSAAVKTTDDGCFECCFIQLKLTWCEASAQLWIAKKVLRFKYLLKLFHKT